MANSASKKRRNRAILVYTLAIIGAWTVLFNAYEIGTSAVNHAVHFVKNVHFTTPTLVSK